MVSNFSYMKGNIMNGSEYKEKQIGAQFVILLIFAWFLLVARVLFAQSEVISDTRQDSLFKDFTSDTDSLYVDTILIDVNSGSKPYLGIVFGRDLDFEKAEELHYPYTYGAYIDDVEDDSPADIAGLTEGDIITRFGKEKIRYNDQLARAVSGYRPGDTVPVILFRDQKIMKTMVTLGSVQEKMEVEFKEQDFSKEVTFHGKKKSSLVNDSDNGLLSWDFIFYAPDNTEFYDEFLTTTLGYESLLKNRNLNDKTYTGLNMTGFYLRPGDQDKDIGVGFFWASNNWNRQKQVIYNGSNFSRTMTYGMDYWGVTLDKQISLFNRLILTGGVLAGTLTSRINIAQEEPLNSWGDINVCLADQEHNNLSVNKKYWLVQPNIALTIPVLGDLGVQIKAGYFYGVPRSNDWKASSLDGEKDVINSPNTSIGGYTFSVGPALILD